LNPNELPVDEVFRLVGKLEAQKMLERRAFNKSRLLGAFNQDIDGWTSAAIRTGRSRREYQLTMLSHSGWPTAAGMQPMLQEKFYHL
jgi:hypothetical protein